MKIQLILIFSFLVSYAIKAEDSNCLDENENYRRSSMSNSGASQQEKDAAKDALQNCFKTRNKNDDGKSVKPSSDLASDASNKTSVSMTGKQPCAAQLEEYKKKNAVTEGQQVTGQSAGVQQCMSITRNNFSNLYKNGNSLGQFKWKKLIEGSELCFKKVQEAINSYGTACAQGEQFPNVAEMFSVYCSNSQSFKTIAARCDAAAYLLSVSDRDWGNKDHLRSDKLSGPITCKSEGIDTLDFEPCVKFVEQSGILDAGVAVAKQTQDLYYKDQAITAQMKASASNDSATGNLKALKEGVKGQEDLLNQRAAIDSAKVAMLYNLYAEVPTRDDITDRCSRYRPSDELLNKDGQVINGCESAINQEPFFAFLENQRAKENMKAKMVKAGLEVTSDLVMAGIMNKRGNDINNAIAKVESFKPIDPLAPQFDNTQSTFCKANPGNAKCLTGGLERTFDVMNDNVITFGEGGTGASYVTSNNPYVDPTATTIDSKNDTKKNSLGSVGNSIAGAHQGSGLESIGAKASVSKGSAPASGGGGGGGGGGGVGGGGGAPAGSQGQGGTMAAVQGKTPSYGGGGGSLSVLGSGGYGINKNKTASAKDDGNPFGKLFNKDGNKSGVVNFGRAPASVGNKGDNIFEMISKRYTNVNNEKRLIEYESK